MDGAIGVFVFILAGLLEGAANSGLVDMTFGPAVFSISPVSLTLVPPETMTKQVDLDVRCGLRNSTVAARAFYVRAYLDEEAEETILHCERVAVPSRSSTTVRFWWKGPKLGGDHRVLLVVSSEGEQWRENDTIRILDMDTQSPRMLGGAWVDIYHHDEKEGRPFNDELAKMSDAQWRELIRAMHAVGQDIVVITMMFQNYTHVGRHTIERDGYAGKAYYPSMLFPGRMPIASTDPLETILDEADRLGMHVLPGIGCYAFFDFTPASLAWHRVVAEEIWRRYGGHRSFYGWYVSDEIAGNLGEDDRRRQQLVDFFHEFRPFVNQLAPGKPVMLATNCHFIKQANGYYERLLPDVDILCPFGFSRMPGSDISGEAAAEILHRLCRRAGCHLWMDLESFEFRNGVELHPRAFDGIRKELETYMDFETVLHYQFPGMMSSPDMSRKPGGDASLKLYGDLQQSLRERNLVPGTSE